MGEVLTALSLVCLAGIILLAVMSVCRFIGLWTWTATWIFSSKEEKMNLTKSKGHFNANGYFVSSDSLGDINMCYSGSFKRFDAVDHDAMSSLTGSIYPSSPQYKLPNYPQDISLPYGTVQSNDLSEFTRPSGTSSTPHAADARASSPATSVLVTSSNHFGPSSVSIPPQPLRPAPAPPPSPSHSSPPPARIPPPPSTPAPTLPCRRSSSTSPPATNFPFPPITTISSREIPPPPTSPAPSLPLQRHPGTLPPVTLSDPVPSPGFTPFISMSVDMSVSSKSPAPILPKVPPRRPPPPVPPRARPPFRRSSGSIEAEENLPQGVHRAVSCDSVCSDTSVALADLLELHVTGQLCISLDYDSDCADLSVGVLEAKNLVRPDDDNHTLMDTYVRVYLLPDKTTNLQTRIYKKSNSPSYKEKFLFGLEPAEFNRRALMFYLYSVDKTGSTLIGEADLNLADVAPRKDTTTWVTLTDTGQERTWWGEIMVSLSYLPTAERLTVVIVKARNLVFTSYKDSGQPFVKVYVLKQGKKIHKKKTTTKKDDRSPVFNEAMIFKVPATSLHTIQVRITAAEHSGESRTLPLGHVILGSDATGKPLSHWAQMLASPRKPVSMWHSLRK